MSKINKYTPLKFPETRNSNADNMPRKKPARKILSVCRKFILSEGNWQPWSVHKSFFPVPNVSSPRTFDARCWALISLRGKDSLNYSYRSRSPCRRVVSERRTPPTTNHPRTTPPKIEYLPPDPDGVARLWRTTTIHRCSRNDDATTTTTTRQM